MWQRDVAKLLNQMGWGSGFRLPIASEENLKLEKELEKRQKLLHEKQGELDSVTKATSLIQDGIKAVSDHIVQDRNLLAAKKTQVQGESELVLLSEREGQKLTAEVKKGQFALRRRMQGNNALMDEIESRRRELSELAELIEYDKANLAIMENRLADEDQLISAIEEIGEMDTDTLRKYETQRRKISIESVKLHQELDSKVALTKTLQSELDAVTSRFRALHKERGTIVGLWKETVTLLADKEDEMKEIAEDYGILDAHRKRLEASVAAERQKVEDRSRVASQANFQLDKWDKKVTDVREEIMEARSLMQTLTDGILTNETAITNASLETQEINQKLKEIEEELSISSLRIKKTQESLKDLRDKAVSNTGEVLTSGERLKALENLVEEEEDKLEQLVKQMEKAVGDKAEWTQKTKLLQKNTMDMNYSIKGNQTALQNLVANIKDSEYKLIRRHSDIYRLEMNYLTLERKYKILTDPKAIAESDNSNNVEEMEAKVTQQRMDLESVKKKRRFVQAQNETLGRVVKSLYQDVVKSKEESKTLLGRSDQIIVSVRFLQRAANDLQEEFETSVVDRTMMKLKLKNLFKALKCQKVKVCSTAEYKELLQAAAKEKRSETEEFILLLNSSKRGMQEEVNRLKVQLSCIVSGMVKKRHRYDILITALTKQEEGGSDEVSEAYLILKMAQEREMLRSEGDKWDKLVKEAEMETAALQNSLALVQCSNDLFKDSLKPITSPDNDLSSLKHQEEEIAHRKNQAVSSLRKTRGEIKKKVEELELMDHHKVVHQNNLIDKEYELHMLERELLNQAMSQKRVRIITTRLLQEITFSNVDEKELVSLDIRLKATGRKFEFAAQALAKLVTCNSDLHEVIAKLLALKFGNEIALGFMRRIGILPAPRPGASNRSNPTSSKGKANSGGRQGQGVGSAKSNKSNTSVGKSRSATPTPVVSSGSANASKPKVTIV